MAVEDLDEMVARKARQATATWGYSYLEAAAGGYYYWQPETLCYAPKDVSPSREVWRMSNTPAVANLYHNDIAVTPWSANGNRLAFYSTRDTGAFARGEWFPWFIVNTNGTKMRPIPDAPARVSTHTLYFHWSPIEADVYFEFGRGYSNPSYSGLTNRLYRVTVTDTGVSVSSSSPWPVVFPTAHGSELHINKLISSNGIKVIASPWDESWLYPATVSPSGSAALDLANGYVIDRGMDSSWGDTPASYVAHHDQYYPGNGTWIFILPSNSHAWWKLKVLGTAADGGAIYSHTPPSTFGEEVPENTIDAFGGNPDPWGCNYWSHPSFDRWGRYVQFTDGDAVPMGAAIWDYTNHTLLVPTFGGLGQHHDWSGWTDWPIGTMGPTGSDYTLDRIYARKYDSAPSQYTVCYTHTLYNNGGVYFGSTYEYGAIPRPAQSPDGTKVAWHSTFLNAKTGTYDTATDVFWAVVYYPKPPTTLSATDTANGISLSWVTPKYTTRGWPTDGDSAPFAKEIKGYHVWMSLNGTTGWTEVTTAAVSSPLAITQANGTTRYYAVTSEEYSGLESEILSEVIRCVIDAGGALTVSITSAEGITGFWATAPTAPVGFTGTKNDLGGGVKHYSLSWTGHTDSKVRYYNLYYDEYSPPTAIQQNRIASIPFGTNSWRDWNPNQSVMEAYYALTAVDRYHNESTVATWSETETYQALIGIFQ